MKKKPLSKGLKDVREEPCRYLREEHSNRGNSKCKGTEVRAYLSCSRRRKEACRLGLREGEEE